MTHLKLDQCKKLKEIGAPQIIGIGTGLFSYLRYATDGHTDAVEVTDTWHEDNEYASCVKRYDLESLLEWLGYTIFLFSLKMDGDSWCAGCGDNIQVGDCGFGATPLEAVYQLALSIHHER